jgi:hypothetical protein
MRVLIEQKELKRGLWGSDRSRIEVNLTVDFSEEEQLIIRGRRLEDVVVIGRPPDALLERQLDPEEAKRWEGRFDLRIGMLLGERTDRYVCGSPAAAKIYSEKLTDTLRLLKLFLLENSDIGGLTAFEL